MQAASPKQGVADIPPLHLKVGMSQVGLIAAVDTM